jgi:hypothetical protein
MSSPGCAASKLLVGYLVGNLRSPEIRLKRLKQTKTMKKCFQGNVVDENQLSDVLEILTAIGLLEQWVVVPKTS